MKKVLSFLFIFMLLFQASVFAHVTNEKTIYDDIQFSKAKEEIVYLRGLSVIPYENGVNLFKPQSKLTKADLAFWATSFKGLGNHDAKKEDLQQAAVDNGLVDSLKGNATYADVNQAYFEGKASVDTPESGVTREQFALFMGQFLNEKVDGQTLFDMAGAEPGPSGTIEKVTVKEEGEGEKAKKVYWLMIEGEKYKISGHPKMLYGPVDLTQWEGKKVKDSWLIKGHNGEKVLQIVALERGQFLEDQSDSNDQDVQTGEGENQAENQTANSVSEQPSRQGFPVVLVVGAVVLLGILAWLFMKKKK
jgi:hypothetical protein